jgi:uncharacterized membrane protein YedE/YeeE
MKGIKKMKIQDKVWLWLAAAVSMVMGSILVLNNNAAGWFLIILGLADIAASSDIAQKWTTAKLNLARWGLIGVMFFAILLAAGVITVILT